MAYSLQTPQTLQEFLAKYAGALDSQGRFVPGRANLEYDGMKAEDVYSLAMGGYHLPSMTGDSEYDAANGGTDVPRQAEVNADWIEDPRAKGWIGQHPTGAAIIGTVLGGVGAQAMGLLGAGGAGSAGGFGAGGASGTLGAGGGFGAGGASGMWGGAAGTAGTAAGTAGAVGAGTSTAAPLSYGAEAVLSGATPGAASLGGAGGGGGLLSTLGSAGKFLAENPTLAKLGGAALGATLAGQDTTTSAQKDPWAPAQPYLKENLQRNSAMQDYYAKNPFSTEQKSAYQGLLDTLANNQANAPAMQGMANSFMGSNRGLLPNMPQFTTGTKAPAVDWTKYQNIGLMG